MRGDANSAEHDTVVDLMTATVDEPEGVRSLSSTTCSEDDQWIHEESCIADANTLCTYFDRTANGNCSTTHQSSATDEITSAELGLSCQQDGSHVSNAIVDQSPDTARDEPSAQTNPRHETWRDWWILVCAFLFNVTTGFNFSTYAILYVPLTELFESTRAAVGWIQSIEIAWACLLSVLVSHPVAVYGCRRVALVGSILLSGGGMLSCLAPNLVWMYILKAVIPGFGASMCLLTSSVIIQQRFNAHRGFATGISVIGFSLGNFICPPLVEYLLHQYSVRGTLLLLGAIQAHRIPLSLQFRTPATLISRPDESSGDSRNSVSRGFIGRMSVYCYRLKSYLRGSLDLSLFRRTSFALFCAAGLLLKFIIYGYLPHTTNWAMAAGLPRQVAVWAVSAVSLMTLTCRLVVACVSDRQCLNRLALFAFGLLLAVLASIPPIAFPGYVGTFISVCLFGIHNGFTNTLLAIVIVDLQGVRNVARSIALFNFITAFPTLAATPLIGWIYDVTGNYFAAFILFIILGLIAFALQLAVIIIERRKRTMTATNNDTQISRSVKNNDDRRDIMPTDK